MNRCYCMVEQSAIQATKNILNRAEKIKVCERADIIRMVATVMVWSSKARLFHAQNNFCFNRGQAVATSSLIESSGPIFICSNGSRACLL